MRVCCGWGGGGVCGRCMGNKKNVGLGLGGLGEGHRD